MYIFDILVYVPRPRVEWRFVVGVPCGARLVLRYPLVRGFGCVSSALFVNPAGVEQRKPGGQWSFLSLLRVSWPCCAWLALFVSPVVSEQGA